jgi:hypothetical protein
MHTMCVICCSKNQHNPCYANPRRACVFLIAPCVLQHVHALIYNNTFLLYVDRRVFNAWVMIL